jgi:hypothetical protein
MCRYSNAFQIRKRRIVTAIKAVGEELFDVFPAEPSRRQADVVNDEQNYVINVRAVVTVGRRHPHGAVEPMIRADSHLHLTCRLEPSCRKHTTVTRRVSAEETAQSVVALTARD